MDKNEFKGILQLLIPSFVKRIIESKNISDDEALTVLYTSTLYEQLENEPTKLWHLSVPTLMSLLDEEIATGKITYPEEA